MGNDMKMMNINKLALSKRPATDLNYEADLKATLEPVPSELLDMAAGLERRKAAYAGRPEALGEQPQTSL